MFECRGEWRKGQLGLIAQGAQSGSAQSRSHLFFLTFLWSRGTLLLSMRRHLKRNVPKIAFSGGVFTLRYSVCFTDATVKSWRNNSCLCLRHIQRNVTRGQHSCAWEQEKGCFWWSPLPWKEPSNDLESSPRAKALYPGPNQCLSWLTKLAICLGEEWTWKRNKRSRRASYSYPGCFHFLHTSLSSWNGGVGFPRKQKSPQRDGSGGVQKWHPSDMSVFLTPLLPHLGASTSASWFYPQRVIQKPANPLNFLSF